jgi:hypothetical protein
MSVKRIFKKPQRYLGPSQFGTVLGFNPYEDVTKLKKRLEEGIWEEVRENCNFGIAKESDVLSKYESDRGVVVERPKWKTYHKNTRLGGIADGIVRTDNAEWGIEVKCHPGKNEPLHDIPKYYLLQISGYMAMYGLRRWELVSACFDDDGQISDYNVIPVVWDDVAQLWEDVWYPKLETFVQTVDWKY